LALETFWQLWRNPPSDQRTGLGGWLYRVATRLGYNALRAAQRRTHYEAEAGRFVLEAETPTDPAHEAVIAEERARVRAILQQMPARESQLLILKHSGLNYQEIAAALSVAPSSIGTLLARAEDEFERRWRETEK
jgi:RNA polymerase sigma-70 factor (ECF subfamily)